LMLELPSIASMLFRSTVQAETTGAFVWNEVRTNTMIRRKGRMSFRMKARLVAQPGFFFTKTAYT
jgi:hypothetical protein